MEASMHQMYAFLHAHETQSAISSYCLYIESST